jgi:hypothetical protein
MLSTASQSPRRARNQIVSAGNGPSTTWPRAAAASTAGAITSISSRPNTPPSPACGLRPATAIRGRSTPARRTALRAQIQALAGTGREEAVREAEEQAMGVLGYRKT